MNEVENFVLALAHALSEVRRDINTPIVWPAIPFDHAFVEPYLCQLKQSAADDAATRAELRDPLFHPDSNAFQTFYGSHADDITALWYDSGGLWNFWCMRAFVGFRTADFLRALPLALVMHDTTPSPALDLSTIRSLECIPVDVLRLVAAFSHPEASDIAMARLTLWERFVANDHTMLNAFEGRRMIHDAIYNTCSPCGNPWLDAFFKRAQ